MVPKYLLNDSTDVVCWVYCFLCLGVLFVTVSQDLHIKQPLVDPGDTLDDI